MFSGMFSRSAKAYYGPTTGPLAACGTPQRYQWPTKALRKNPQI